MTSGPAHRAEPAEIPDFGDLGKLAGADGGRKIFAVGRAKRFGIERRCTFNDDVLEDKGVHRRTLGMTCSSRRAGRQWYLRRIAILALHAFERQSAQHILCVAATGRCRYGQRQGERTGAMQNETFCSPSQQLTFTAVAAASPVNARRIGLRPTRW